jgi:hypothetical protein
MAIVKYSGLITEIRGNLGGAVFQRMGQSLGIRSQVGNRTSTSIRANLWRQIISILAARWLVLSSTNKALWISAAPSWPALDRFGNVIKLNGYQLYLQVNSLMWLAISGTIDFPGSWFTLPTYTSSIANLSVSAASFNYTITAPGDADVVYLVYASDSYPFGSINRNAKTKFIDRFSSGDAGIHNLYNQYMSVCQNALVVGSSVFFEVWELSLSTGVYKNTIAQYISVVA